jgi:hypothetical protein
LSLTVDKEKKAEGTLRCKLEVTTAGHSVCVFQELLLGLGYGVCAQNSCVEGLNSNVILGDGVLGKRLDDQGSGFVIELIHDDFITEWTIERW